MAPVLCSDSRTSPDDPSPLGVFDDSPRDSSLKPRAELPLTGLGLAVLWFSLVRRVVWLCRE